MSLLCRGLRSRKFPGCWRCAVARMTPKLNKVRRDRRVLGVHENTKLRRIARLVVAPKLLAAEVQA